MHVPLLMLHCEGEGKRGGKRGRETEREKEREWEGESEKERKRGRGSRYGWDKVLSVLFGSLRVWGAVAFFMSGSWLLLCLRECALMDIIKVGFFSFFLFSKT